MSAPDMMMSGICGLVCSRNTTDAARTTSENKCQAQRDKANQKRNAPECNVASREGLIKQQPHHQQASR
jgi:hypothetical protein